MWYNKQYILFIIDIMVATKLSKEGIESLVSGLRETTNSTVVTGILDVIESVLSNPTL
jgi:hypothetical protein